MYFGTRIERTYVFVDVTDVGLRTRKLPIERHDNVSSTASLIKINLSYAMRQLLIVYLVMLSCSHGAFSSWTLGVDSNEDEFGAKLHENWYI